MSADEPAFALGLACAMHVAAKAVLAQRRTHVATFQLFVTLLHASLLNTRLYLNAIDQKIT